MSTITRDPWADAGMVATQTVLADDLAAVRRRLRWRRALGLALALGALLAAMTLVDHFVDTRSDPLWTVPRRTRDGAFGLAGVGFVLVFLGIARRGSAGRGYLDPADFLPRADRAWLRTQIAERRTVPDERRVVVADSARRMVAEGRFTPSYLGWVLISVGMVAAAPLLGSVIVFSALALAMTVWGARALVGARRARRWLSQHGSGS